MRPSVGFPSVAVPAAVATHNIQGHANASAFVHPYPSHVSHIAGSITTVQNPAQSVAYSAHNPAAHVVHAPSAQVAHTPSAQVVHAHAAHSAHAHTEAYEAGGMSMVDLANAMRADAEAQEKLVKILSDMLDETVKRNDSLQVGFDKIFFLPK